MDLGILVTLASSWCLLGLSLTVAIVVYPSFSLVGPERWARFHVQHSRRITLAVGPPWLAQAAGLAVWLLAGPGSTLPALLLCGVGALAAVLLTVAGAVPVHERLSAGFDGGLHRRLLRWHWARTLAWLLSAAAATVAAAQQLA